MKNVTFSVLQSSPISKNTRVWKSTNKLYLSEGNSKIKVKKVLVSNALVYKKNNKNKK